MAALLHHFDQVSERRGVGGLGMNEENRGTARALARRFIDDVKAALFM